MDYPEFIRCEPPIDDDDLDAAEAEMGIVLPSDLRQLYLKFNGGRPVKNGFQVGNSIREVRKFYPVKYGIPGDPQATLEGSYAIIKDVVPEGLIPFSDTSAGNMYCYSTAKPTMHAICYWNHEQHKQPYKGVTVIAPSLQDFLDSLVDRPA